MQKQRMLELSERELMALDAARSAIEGATKCPVILTFVRKFRAGRIAMFMGRMEICRVRLTFGFRRRDMDVCGVADAVVNLQHSPQFIPGMFNDREYHVWTPYDVEVTVRGDVPLKPGAQYVSLKIGSEDWRASYRVYAGSRA